MMSKKALLPIRALEGCSKMGVGISKTEKIIYLENDIGANFINISDIVGTEKKLEISFSPCHSISSNEFIFLYGDYSSPNACAMLKLANLELKEEKLHAYRYVKSLLNDCYLIYLSQEESKIGSIFKLDLNTFEKFLIADTTHTEIFSANCPEAIEMNEEGDIALGLKNGKIEFWKNEKQVCVVGNLLPSDAVCVRKMLSYSSDGKTLYDFNLLLDDEQKERHIVRFFCKQDNGEWKQLTKILEGGFTDGAYDLNLNLGQDFLIYYKINSNIIFAIDLLHNQVYGLNNGKGKIMHVNVQRDLVMVTSEYQSEHKVSLHKMESFIPQKELSELFETQLEGAHLAKDRDMLRYTVKFIDDVRFFSLPFTFSFQEKNKKSRKIEIKQLEYKEEQLISNI